MTIREQLAPHIQRFGQSRLADELQRRGVPGCQQSHLSAWMHGRRNLKDYQLEAIADVLGVEIHCDTR